MTEENKTFKATNAAKETGLNLDPKKLLNELLRFWWLFLISVPVSYAVVTMIHRYTVPIYGASMTLIVDERGESDSRSSMMEGFGLTPGMRNVDNQIAVLSSWDMVRNTVEQLDFYVSYFAGGRLKNTELYGNLDFTVVFDSAHAQLVNVPINIKMIDEHSYMLKVSCENGSLYNYSKRVAAGNVGALEYSEIHRFNQTVVTPWMAVNIRKNGNGQRNEQYFVFNTPESVVGQYKSTLRVAKTGENSSIIALYVSGVNHAKNMVFLNKLADVFIEANLNQKNKIASNTISFIESQLGNISDSLRIVGSELSHFRTSNKIQSVTLKGDHLYSEVQRFDNEIGKLKLDISYYKYLINYFAADTIDNGVIAPAMMDVKSGIMGQLINQLIEINSERMNLAQTYGQPNHPTTQELKTKFNIARNVLTQAINNHLEMVKDEIRQLELKKSFAEEELFALPETERKMLGIERKFQLNNEVYTFLLRKRSESQIQKASNTPDHKVMESARYAGQISPNVQADKKKAVMVGVLLPLAFIVVRVLLSRKIEGVGDIAKITNLPIIGEIIHNNKDVVDVVIQHPKSVIAESFRRLRTRLEFMAGDIESPVIAISSSMPGEGKTFCALNVASVYAISGKKTVLLGFDLRRPGMNKALNLDKQVGISNYLIGKCTLDEIIINDLYGNLSVIPSGDIPPNPSELIGSQKAKQLLGELKKRFDIIIVDTPPMGIVSDTYLLARMSDVLIFLVRDHYTIREIFASSVQSIADEGIEHVGILLNDQNIEGRKYAYRYGRGYRYHYGYNTGYYED